MIKRISSMMTMAYNFQRTGIQGTAFCILLLLLFCITPRPIIAQSNEAGSADAEGFNQGAGAQVSESTGQIQYSIPISTIQGLEGEAYGISLSYSPPQPNAESSWVGLGWSLSPGAVTRMQNGIPDDFHGVEVINISKKPAYVRLSGTITAGGEILSALNGSVGKGSVWDSERGILPTVSLKLSAGGANINYFSEAGDGIFSWSFNPLQFAANKVFHNKSGNNSDDSADGPVAANLETSTEKTEAKSGYDWDKWTKNLIQNGINKLPGWNSKKMTSMPIYENDVEVTSFGFVASGQVSLAPDIGPEIGIVSHFYAKEEEPIGRINTYGYLYSGSDDRTSRDAMDFMEERSSNLDEFDKFVATPVATPDQFSVNAQGLGGSFRPYFTAPGTFHSREFKYNTSVDPTLGLEFAGGILNLTGGASVSINGKQKFEFDDWVAKDAGERYEFSDDRDQIFMAFDNDLAMLKSYDTGGRVLWANKNNGVKELKLNETIQADVTPQQRTPQSKWVRWNTIGEMKSNSNTGVQVKRFCQQDLTSKIDLTTLKEDGIGEYQIVAETGVVYTFGLPVYTRNQVDLSYSLQLNYPALPAFDPTSSSDVEEEKIVLYPAPDIQAFLSSDNETDLEEAIAPYNMVSGKIIREPVAMSYLLTSVVSPDFVDLDWNGPDEGDLGTWVKFEYDQLYGSADKEAPGGWFSYRNPIRGSRYSEGNIADPRDDMGSFSAGEKEVYVLKSIETKSHIAIFHVSNRLDGFAVDDWVTASKSQGLSPTDQLQRLDKVEVFKKRTVGNELISTTEFDYDYSLAQGTPSNGSTSSSTSDKGKLTLTGLSRKMNDTVDELSEYHFDYSYMKSADLPSSLPSDYVSLFAEYDHLSTADQNPDYSPNLADAWGNARRDNSGYWTRHNHFEDRSSVSSTKDPAAYFLKQVTQPSGATVLLQYEPGDYAFVQDQPAEVMVPIASVEGVFDDKVYLDLESVDLLDEGYSLNEWATHLENHFSKNRVYFKFLYCIRTFNCGDATDPSTGHRYFTGFVAVDEVGVDADGLYVTLDSSSDYGSPLSVCRDYVEKFPKVQSGEVELEATVAGGDVDGIISTFIQRVASAVSPLDLGACSDLVVAHSFLRIPLIEGKSKNGGSVRIKRMMTLDHGLEPGSAMLFGQSYDYKEYNAEGVGSSSGVASNEPASMYEECALFKPLPKQHQSLLSKAFSGKDTEKLTGPIGEAFLPNPSVIYGNVIAHHISSRKNSEGFTQSRYFTHLTHPTSIRWSSEDKTLLKQVKVNIPAVVYNKTENELWFSQGFEVEHSSLPGMTIGREAFGGNWNNPESWTEVYKEENEYFGRDELIPCYNKWNSTSQSLGHFEEIYFHGRQIYVEQQSGSAELDLSTQIIPPAVIPIPSGFPSYSESKQTQAIFGTTKIITHPAILKGARKIQSGREMHVENVGFDPMTGHSIIQSTTDGFSSLEFDQDADGSSEAPFNSKNIRFDLTGHDWHEELGGMFINDRRTFISDEDEFSGIQIKKWTASGNHWLEFCPKGGNSLCDPVDLMEYFQPGDLLKIYHPSFGGYLASSNKSFFYVTEIQGNTVLLHTSSILGSQTWTESDVTVEILRSGRKNDLRRKIGTLHLYDDGLSTSTSSRVGSDLDALIARMNAAIPNRPNTGVSIGIENLHGTNADTLKILEHGCQKLGSISDLTSFTVEFNSAGCSVGAVYYPSNTQIPTVYDDDDGSIAVPPSSGPTRIIPIHFANSIWDDPGQFSFDEELGSIVWTSPDNECNPVVIFTPCSDLTEKTQVDNVIASNIAHISDDLNFIGLGGPRPYENGSRGRWFSKGSAVFNERLSGLLDESTTHSTQAGILDEFEMFSIRHPEWSNRRWVQSVSNEIFDKNGHPIESTDALGQYSSRKYRDDSKLTVWESQDARYRSCKFESFENLSGNILTDSEINLSGTPYVALRTGGIAHTGAYSMKLQSLGAGCMGLGTITIDEAIVDAGLRVRFWAREERDASGKKHLTMNDIFKLRFREVGIVDQSANCTPYGTLVTSIDADSLAQTGAWVLLEAILTSSDISSAGLTAGDKLALRLGYTKSTPSAPVYVDDIKIQPVKSNMICHVYDPRDFKKTASLDENHFAIKYRYNARREYLGNMIETLEGFKAVGETQIHLKSN